MLESTTGMDHTMVPNWYTCTYHGIMVPGTMVHVYKYNIISKTPWYVRTYAMQALVRVQAHMLARIVVEIRAADIAVELEPQL